MTEGHESLFAAEPHTERDGTQLADTRRPEEGESRGIGQEPDILGQTGRAGGHSGKGALASESAVRVPPGADSSGWADKFESRDRAAGDDRLESARVGAADSDVQSRPGTKDALSVALKQRLCEVRERSGVE